MTQTAIENIIQLDCSKKGKVVVTPQEQDRFVLTVQQATAACLGIMPILQYREQFVEGLMPKLIGWLEDHRKQIHKAFLTIRDGGLMLLVVRNKAEFDREFTDELTTFDMEVAQDAGLSAIRLDVLALPKVSDKGAMSFMSPGRIKELTNAG